MAPSYLLKGHERARTGWDVQGGTCRMGFESLSQKWLRSQLKVVATMVARLIAAALGECLVQMMRVLIQMVMLVLAR